MELFHTTPLRSTQYVAYRLGIQRPEAEQLLFELVQEGALRADRPKGSIHKTYSMITAPENKLIDTFISQLCSIPISENRFIQRKQYELDAVIRTKGGTTYAVETMYAHDRLSRKATATRIQRLETAKRQLGIPDAIGVLLVGITKATKRAKDNLKMLERPSLLIRYVEME
jgi:hypothetical protein